MSAVDFRDRAIQLIETELYGDGVQSGGLIATVKSGGIQDLRSYGLLCGKIKGLEDCIEHIKQAFQDVFNPQPEEKAKEIQGG